MSRVFEGGLDILVHLGTLEGVRIGQGLFVFKLGEIGADRICSEQCLSHNSKKLGTSYGIEFIKWHVEAKPTVLCAGLINHPACSRYSLIIHLVIMPSGNVGRYRCPLSCAGAMDCRVAALLAGTTL